MIEMENVKKSNFIVGPILPTLMKFAMPILLALFIQALYGAVDLWVVGKYCGSADVSAVATGSQTMLIITGALTGLAVGVTVFLALKYGEGEYEKAADTIGTSILLFLGISIVLTIIMVIAAPKIALVMNAPPAAMEKTIKYILICSSGIVFITGYNLLAAIFRGLGNSNLPLLFVLIACFFNILGDIVLVKYLHMDAAGTAIATIFAQAMSVLMSFFVILKQGFPFPFSKKNLKFKFSIAKTVVKLGFPIAFQDMCNEISFLVLIGIVNSLGLIESAGVGIAERIVMFMLLIPVAYMSSISAFVAQNIGAGEKERAKRSLWVGMSTAVILGGISSYLSFFHGDKISMIFSQDAEVIKASATFLKATSIECFILSIAYCFTGYFNGLGRTTFVMVQGLIATYAVRIPYAYLARRQPVPSLFNIGFSAVAAALFTLIVCIVYYHRKAKEI
ncbi:MAG: MATE family efflux transporter [Tissierellia bacterium]|nr:MATE family efflux transporter [Tissierellia bacterium]